jgi:methionyl-tRNA formyltransferase
VTYASKITVEDAQIDWTKPADQIHRLIRSCAPAPGAWTTFCGQRLKINAAIVTDNSLPTGALHVTKRSVQVGTGTTSLELTQVQAQGKKPMAAPDWARGISFGDHPTLNS